MVSFHHPLRVSLAVAAVVALFVSGCPTDDCGDGILDPNEACDNGPNNADTPNACRTTCEVPTCGDSVVDDDAAYGCEQCDDGPVATGGPCGNDCRILPDTVCDAMATVDCCGNGIVEGTEECDDGNTLNLDGCESNCTDTPLACMP